MSYKYKSKDIRNALINYIERPDITWLPNCYFGGGECDLLAVSFHGYATEYEIKVSMSDWTADKGKNKWTKETREKISYFYYCIPINLYAKIPKWVDDNFGIITFEFREQDGVRWLSVVEQRKAQKLEGTRKLTEKEIGAIIKKGWYRYKDIIMRQVQEELKQL